ncbi:MAG TPA: transaldolase [Candidatus Eisenbacteria bacterium]|nr:transaldolase [Candidatus Eisenbacteria bacterium]
MTQAQSMTENPVKQALRHGQSIWYDGLIGRDEFERMIREDGLRGATTNPSIFEKALASVGTDPDVAALVASKPADEVYKTLAVKAVQEVCDLFRPLYAESAGQDGFVSIEVSPLLAYDTLGTIREGKELWQRVDRKNVMIKVPATRQGLPAIEALIGEGINVNVTLIFSVKRYQEVMNAYVTGIEKRIERGRPVADTASVASFFVSRIDSAVDKLIQDRLDAAKSVPMGTSRAESLRNLTGKVAIANAKLAYKEFDNFFQAFRFRRLKEKGAQIQRPLWASTGTKNPAYSDVLYVEELMGQNTVNTMPPATLDAFRHHGVAGSRLMKGMEEASNVFKELQTVGIDFAEVTDKLEEAGVKLFADSYNKIIQSIGALKK